MINRTIIAKHNCFLVENARPNGTLLQEVMKMIGSMEEDVFREREEREKEQERRKSRGRFAQRKSSPPSPHPECAEPGGLPIIKSPEYICKQLGDDADDYRLYYYFDKFNMRIPGRFFSEWISGRKQGDFGRCL